MIKLVNKQLKITYEKRKYMNLQIIIKKTAAHQQLLFKHLFKQLKTCLLNMKNNRGNYKNKINNLNKYDGYNS